MKISQKELVCLRCCCLEFDRKCYEIECCQFHRTLNANILGLRAPNLMKFFLGDGQIVFFNRQCLAKPL